VNGNKHFIVKDTGNKFQKNKKDEIRILPSKYKILEIQKPIR
jgi:hypothetical protein